MATPPSPPLTLAENYFHGSWECCTCITRYNNEVPWQTNEGDLVCKECIMPLFETAMKFDFEYPARWGGVEMRIDDFTILWHDGVFPASYKAKGAQLKRNMLAAAMNSEEFMPDGLVVGKDIQSCPKCKTPWGLKEGCNHMTCKTCSTEYCFVCGQEASDKSGHWSNPQNGGSCPRWGRLEDGSGIFDNEQGEDEVDWSEEISFQTWVWNVAIQHVREPQLLLMQRMLGVPLPNVPQRQLSTVEQNRVLLGILQYRPQHGVSRQVWATTLVEYRHDAMTFMEELNVFFGENFDEDPIWNGVLARPIGGVFNLSSASARRDAYEWAQNAYSAWTPATAENPINYAIFDVGPGALEDRVQAKEMLDNLTVLGHEATGGCLEFSVVSSVFGIYLLAHITGLHNHLDRHMARIGLQANPLWSLRFEFIRPQNDREIMQRQVMRVEYGWHGEAPQRQVHIDPDLEQALLAEVEDLRQVRMLDVEVAAEAQLDETRRRMDLIDGLVRLTLEERQQQNEGFGRRLRELAREPRAQEAAFSAEAENEAIAAQDIAPARAEEAAPRHRRSPSAEQSLEPWVQPWDELTRAMPDSQVPQSTPEDSPNAGRDFGAGL